MKKNTVAGVYKILNVANGKIYIGSAYDFISRKSHHFCDLRKNKHRNKHLQNAYNKYGESSLLFIPMIICDRNNTLMYEQRALDIMKPEYNNCPTAGNCAGTVRTEEQKLHLSRMNSGRKLPKNKKWQDNLNKSLKGRSMPKLSEAHKAKIGSFAKKNNSKTYGGLVSPDGIVYKFVHNLNDFCRKHSLNQAAMWRLYNNRAKSHKGWKLYE